MGRTYRFFISGGVSDRFFGMILELPQNTEVFDPGLVTITNFIRGQDEAYFDMFISSEETSDSFYVGIADIVKEWLISNQVVYEALDTGG